jgi:FtsP/CotA-like multicopper oxidase with cupredoxin domain
MKTTTPLAMTTATLLAGVVGCASTMAVQVPELPAALRPTAGEVAFLEALAAGVQIYECAAKQGGAGGYEWQFRAPEATLTDRAGRSLGKHYAGPTWEATDGSKVVGEVKARDPGPKATAIPWLLLNAKSTMGTGVFAKTKSIQRVDTVAGVAPSSACEAANVGQVARVPYTATYYYYRSAN